jgi:DNA-binding phage protein
MTQGGVVMPRRKKEEAPGLIQQLKDAIRGSGKSLYRISKDSGVGSDQLSRFLTGKRTLELPAVERICRALNLQLTPGPPQLEPKKATPKEQEK